LEPLIYVLPEYWEATSTRPFSFKIKFRERREATHIKIIDLFDFGRQLMCARTNFLCKIIKKKSSLYSSISGLLNCIILLIRVFDFNDNMI
jgi:hypothetical protein